MDNNKNIAIMGDEDTITGFRLTGLVYTKNNPNFVPIERDDTDEKAEMVFNELIARSDIAIIFISEFVKPKIFKCINNNNHNINQPTIIFIPNK